MKRLIYKLLFSAFLGLIGVTSALSHDVKMATFSFFESGEKIEFVVKLDLEDLKAAIKKEQQVLGKNWNELVNQYVNKNLNLSINDETVPLQFEDQEQDHEWITLRLSMNIGGGDLEKIKIWNTCLLASVEGQNNIIHAELNGKLRSFRMGEDRQILEFNY